MACRCIGKKRSPDLQDLLRVVLTHGDTFAINSDLMTFDLAEMFFVDNIRPVYAEKRGRRQ